MTIFLERIMMEAPRGLVDVLAVIVVVAFFACAIALTRSMVRKARG